MGEGVGWAGGGWGERGWGGDGVGEGWVGGGGEGGDATWGREWGGVTLCTAAGLKAAHPGADRHYLRVEEMVYILMIFLNNHVLLLL